MSNAAPSNTDPGFWARYEAAALAALLAVFIGVNAATVTWFPQSWVDEVMYTDPAARFVEGKGFTSAAWPSQSTSEFWAGNTPLHEFLLIPWLEAFGVSAASVRVFDNLLGFAGIYLLWRAVKLAGWIPRAPWRLALVTLLATGYGMAHLFHSGRPDSITLLVAAALAWQYARGNKARKGWLTYLLAAVSPWAGLQVATGIALLLGILFVLTPGPLRGFTVRVAVGMAAGVVALMAMYASAGVARQFIENTVASGHALTGDLAQIAVYHDGRALSRASNRLSDYLHFYRAWWADRSSALVLISLGASVWWAWRRGRFAWRGAPGRYLAAALGVPVLMLFAGKYPIYYTWMGYTITSVGAAGLACAFWEDYGPAMRVLAAGPLAAACVAGLPVLLGQALEGERVDAAGVAQFVRSQVGPGDSALVDGSAYFATTGRAAETLYVGYAGGRGLKDIPPEQRKALTVLAVNASDFEMAAKKTGGDWRAVARYEIPESPFGKAITLTIYRRTTDTSRP